MKRILLSILVLFVVFLSSCSRKGIINQDYRVAHPNLKDIIADTTKSIGIISLTNSNYQLLKDCPSPDTAKYSPGAYENDPRDSKKHEALSQSAFEFELNNSLDSLFREFLPNNPRNYLIPGVAVLENDSMLDILVEAARNNSKWNMEMIGKKKVSKITYKENTPNDLKEYIRRISARYDSDFLILPLDASLIVNPDSPCSRNGEFEIKILFSFWDGRSGDVIYLLYSHHKLDVSSSENNLNRGWTREFINFISEDLKLLIGGVEK